MNSPTKIAVAAAWTVAAAGGQDRPPQQARVGFYNATFSTVHFISPNRDPYALSYTPLWTLGNDTRSTASAAVGAAWVRSGSVVEMRYTPSYSASALHPEANRWNHLFSLHGLGDRGVRLTSRLRLSFGVNSSVTDYQQFLLTPTAFSRAALSGAGAEELAAGAISGQFTDPELAAALSGSPLVESPARLLFFGNRLFNASARVGLTYLASPRLRYNIQATGNHYQHLTQRSGYTDEGRYLIPHTTYAGGAGGLDYSLSPRSQIGFTVGAGNTYSPLQRTRSANASSTYGRRFGQNWFFTVNGGAGHVYSKLGETRDNTRTFAIGGGNLGYSVGRHTFLANASRTVSEEVGLGTGVSISMRGAWGWQIGRTAWNLHADFGRQMWTRDRGEDFGGWRGAAGVGRRLPGNLYWSAGALYIAYTGNNFGGPPQISLASFRTSITWTPTGLSIR